METITLNIWICTDRARSRMDIKVKVEKEDWDNWSDTEKENFVKEILLDSGRIEWGYTIE